jgi:hypothetical protein
VPFVNGFRRATSPPVTIASFTNNPVRQGRLGLVRCFPNTRLIEQFFDEYFLAVLQKSVSEKLSSITFCYEATF